jgi:lauroyl/myristoyl acyltransferase
MAADAATTAHLPPTSTAAPGVSLWQRFTFSVVRTFLWGVMVLFSLRGLYLLGQWFGTLEWLINYRHRRRFRRRLKAVSGGSLPAKERRRQARRFFRRTRCDKIFYLIFDRIPKDKAISRFHVARPELLEEAIGRGRGCFVATAHFGANHVAAMLLALRGYKVAGVRDPHEGGIRRYVQALFDRRYPEFGRVRIMSSEAYPRDIYRCFQDNYVLGASLDVQRVRDAHKRSVRVRLFEQEREYPVGTVQIALRCGAGVLQGFIVSEPNFHYRFDLLGPLVPSPAPPESPELLQQAMQTYADNVERYLREYPDHLSRA